MKIHVGILTHNEPEVFDLLRLIHMAKGVGAVQVVDDMSAPEFAARLQAMCYEYAFHCWQRPLHDDFSTQRNRLLGNFPKGDWVCMLDADEMVSPEFFAEVSAAMENYPDADSFFIRRKNTVVDPDGKESVTYERHVRVFKNRYRFVGAVHEGIAGCTSTGSLPLEIMHRKTEEKCRLQNRFYKEHFYFKGTPRSFKHSGDAGDVVWSLPVVRCVGGGDFYLGKSNVTRVKMGTESYRNIAPLLEAQQYIRKVDLWTGRGVAFDLDQFRQFNLVTGNLARCHLRAFGLPECEVDRAWLEAEPKAVAPVVINLTARYPQPHFPWSKVVEKYKGNCVFVGAKEEHESFEQKYGPIPFQKTRHLLQLAEIIAGCKLFVSNQGCANAIAEGLKQRLILAIGLQSPTCIFPRPGAQFVAGARIELPEISELR